jgi:hypothetical protein
MRFITPAKMASSSEYFSPQSFKPKKVRKPITVDRKSCPRR